MEPEPKIARGLRSEQERLFRCVLGVLRYGGGDGRDGGKPWLSAEQVLNKVLKSGLARARRPCGELTLEGVKAAIERDPTRIETFAWREYTWARAKARVPRVVPPRRFMAPPGLEALPLR